jgi:hypothetical protein
MFPCGYFTLNKFLFEGVVSPKTSKAKPLPEQLGRAKLSDGEVGGRSPKAPRERDNGVRRATGARGIRDEQAVRTQVSGALSSAAVVWWAFRGVLFIFHIFRERSMISGTV